MAEQTKTQLSAERWRYEIDPRDENPFPAVEIWEDVNGDAGLIATVHADGPDCKRSRLIAATPELLDLAEGVVTAYGDKLLPTPTEKHLLDGARALIARVIGGAE